MPRRPAFAYRSRPMLTVLPLIAVAALALVIARASAPHAAGDTEPHTMHMAMTAAAMRQRLADWYAVHPAHGGSFAAAPVDSFTATGVLSGLLFDRDHNAATVVDTAHITRGDAIRFKWVSGVHTVTSGTGNLDPDLGAMFDSTLASAANNFSIVFDTVGTFPFFCFLHEGVNMRGVVVVKAVALATQPGTIAIRTGFLSPPWPNPTRTGMTCRLALSRPGRARVEVLDMQGRRVAVAMDRELGAGEFTAAWDGRAAGGALAPAGVYLVRFSGPGKTESRRVSLER